MGRWGTRLFESDHDLDMTLELNDAFSDVGQEKIPLSHMINQTDMLAPPEARAYYQTNAYHEELKAEVASIREKLDSGLCDRLFTKYRAKENEVSGEYRVILLGALMMRAGAKIKDDDFQHLRDLVPRINCNEGYALPFVDRGFRGPGKRQFLAALDNYQPGVPRNYQEPRKIEMDIGRQPLLCSRCKCAWYCDTNCQRGHWRQHKPSCVKPENVRMLNV